MGHKRRRKVEEREARRARRKRIRFGMAQAAKGLGPGKKKKKKSKKKITILPTQVLNKPKKKGKLKALTEKKTLLGKAAKFITSPKTTGVLATTLAALGTGGAALGAKAAATTGRAIITRTAIRSIGKRTTSLVSQRAFPGKPITSGVNKLFHAIRPIATRFAANTKSQGLTKSLLSKTGLSLGAASLAVGAIGSYPFAGFIKEEAVQTLGFAFNTAERNKDVIGMENAIAETDEIINNADSIMDKVPYANVLKQLRSFFEAAQVKLENDRRRLETLRGEQETGETAFGAERRAADEQARQRTLEQREIDSQYFALIREGKFEEAEELLQEELKGGESNG